MTVDELTSLDPDEMAELVSWRLGLLRASGYAEDDALALARRVDVSVYEAVRIVAEGASPDSALASLV